jgi:hypothetical protein
MSGIVAMPVSPMRSGIGRRGDEDADDLSVGLGRDLVDRLHQWAAFRLVAVTGAVEYGSDCTAAMPEGERGAGGVEMGLYDHCELR